MNAATKRPLSINQIFDRIEKLCDEHGAQVTITRAAGTWLGFVKSADGEQVNHQSPRDQKSLMLRVLASLESLCGGSA